MIMIEKVTAFILRERDLLLLRHPYAGILSAGTVSRAKIMSSP
jgi:hypothetical protein